ncbi:MAG TPA: hypothetical protein VLX64_04445 [Thermoplasmata archaeon]|nr:hypothetical protein [Thermoplasmata archaeon]
MARRREIELSVERPLGPAGPAGGVARLTVRWDAANEAGTVPIAELRAEFDRLTSELEALVGAPLAALPAARADRDVTELVETYRPRQRDLVDLLLSDGEISPVEHGRLVEHLSGARAPAKAPAPPLAAGDAPIAAAPVASEGALPPARPVAELLRTYQIASLKQAGAVRARRQISFAEYMALKRHFETAENEGAGPGGLR